MLIALLLAVRRCVPTADGLVAEWLRSGLQIRVPQFNSGRGLQYLSHGRSSLRSGSPPATDVMARRSRPSGPQRLADIIRRRSRRGALLPGFAVVHCSWPVAARTTQRRDGPRRRATQTRFGRDRVQPRGTISIHDAMRTHPRARPVEPSGSILAGSFRQTTLADIGILEH